ncbi:phage terminase small subunit [Sporosarcina newyorkensis 2681]|uniref:Phage terminase small subunit n=1 Tax=Sporosarcina newyorkensis 2681 TaxID=1027292 RepID=F9DX39_9BACL|nr:terminase small subunit [Sporosarcina newyorkensis]EGQ21087.1 phage terminase small subunit [Sporosarcina newyorkensis 2681]
MPNWEEIQREWETSKITLAALAEKHDVKLGTLKSRKSRDTKDGNSWTRGAPKKVATKTQKVATPSKRMQPKKEQFEPVVESDDLTDKQRLFCIYYIKSFNATMSAIKAGYATNSAHVEGSRLLRNAKVADEIRRLKGEMQQGVFIDAMDVLNKYIQIAFADITDYVMFGSAERQAVDEQGRPKLDDNFKPITYRESYVDLKNHDMVDGTIITEVKEGREGVSVKLADKMKALEMLTKYFDLLPEHQKRRLEEEKMKLELGNLRGDTEGDPHAQGSSYEDALNAQTEDVFADEVIDDET